MILRRLKASNFRCFAEIDLEFGSGLNLVTGGNGAGKTSLVEAAHLLGYGRSFRGRVRDGLIRTGASELELFAEWMDGKGQGHRAGLRHTGQSWEARMDGANVASLTEFCAGLAVVTFEPGSHELIAGSADQRRRYLDWGLFHVERSFLPVWRRYGRALKQRNALLKSRPDASSLSLWDRELAEAGKPLHRLRQAYLQGIEPTLAAAASEYLGELGAFAVDYLAGWRRQDMSLEDALLLNRERDLALGYTSVGPHRADWSFRFEGLPGRESLSRGQEKLTALSCILGQARAFEASQGEWPLLCLDDLASELDAAHQQRVLESVLASGAQVLLTGTEAPAALPVATNLQMFHVERQQIRAR
ncbi:DNA replication/repair protein RecF [Arenimonas sp.]|uniref:DNA replication/repair protein RecF n=1 Tax=Arenimonas sp. TaxID=1872635 RepID=UPI0039E51387